MTYTRAFRQEQIYEVKYRDVYVRRVARVRAFFKSSIFIFFKMNSSFDSAKLLRREFVVRNIMCSLESADRGGGEKAEARAARSESGEKQKRRKKCTGAAKETFHGSANENAQKIVGAAVCRRFLRPHIFRIPAVPVETYHRMRSCCRCDSAVPPRPMEIARDFRTFFTSLSSTSRCPIPSAFYSFHVPLGLRVDNIVSFAPLVNQTISVGFSMFYWGMI